MPDQSTTMSARAASSATEADAGPRSARPLARPLIGVRAPRRALGAVAAGLLLAACGAGTSTATSTATGSGPWGWSGDATSGYQPSNEPDVNQDGQVVVGILSPGDTSDHGYYESFVDAAKQYATSNGWKVITVDKVNPADAVTQARNLCRQKVDMVAVAASQLKDAIPVAQEDVCRNTVWYVAGGQGVTQNAYFTQSQDVSSESGYASGVAAGELLAASGKTKAGFVTGPEADFTTSFARAWYAGIKSVDPSATVAVTYTGDFDDSTKAIEAMKAQESQGIGLVYPYLGGATDAVTAEANRAGIPAMTPGTDRCGGGTPTYAVSVIFSPGDYFAAALAPFKAGTLKVGTARVWHMGKDPVPAVKICTPTGDQQARVDAVEKQIGDGSLKPDQAAAAVTLP